MGTDGTGRLRVAHYGLSYLPLTENWIYSQLTGLECTEVSFFALYRENEDRFPLRRCGCLFSDLGRMSLLANRAWRKVSGCYPTMLRWMRAERPHLLHAHFGPRGWEALTYARRLGVPLVTSFYGADAWQFPVREPAWNERYCELFDEGRLFLAEGPAMGRRLEALGCDPDKVAVHRIGVALGSYECRPRKLEGPLRLLACCRFEEKKGMPLAVEALARLRRGGVAARLTIVGDSDRRGTLTPEKRKILAAIEDNGLEEAVTITGYLSHEALVEQVHGHHLFLAPSIHAADGDAEGGFPVILTEVLSSGMPVVASDHCDIPAIVEHGVSGIIVPQGDAGALARGIGEMLERAGEWPEMGRRGRRFVEEHHDIGRLNRELEALYREAVDS